MRILGLDLGTKTIGVALSDELGYTAQPLTTLTRKKFPLDLKEVLEIIRQYQVKEIVVGLPKNMNGTLGKFAQEVLDWKALLEKESGIPIITWDERLSTVAVTKELIKADLSRQKRKKLIDKLAATYILQGYLDNRNLDRE